MCQLLDNAERVVKGLNVGTFGCKAGVGIRENSYFVRMNLTKWCVGKGQRDDLAGKKLLWT